MGVGDEQTILRRISAPAEWLRVPTPSGGQTATFPRWRADGSELFYLDWHTGRRSTRVFAVPITTRPALTVGEPRLLFELPRIGAWFGWDVMPDGQGFVVVQQPEAHDVVLVQNWFELVRHEWEARGGN